MKNYLCKLVQFRVTRAFIKTTTHVSITSQNLWEAETLITVLVRPSFVHQKYYQTLCEPRFEKTGLRGFRPGPTETGLYSSRRWLEACKFVYKKKRDCTIYLAKTKALISFAITAKLICVFVFAYAKSRFSHDAAHAMYVWLVLAVC